MAQETISTAPTLNMPTTIYEDGMVSRQNGKHKAPKSNEDKDDELIFEAIDDNDSCQSKIDEKSPSSDEGIQLGPSTRRVQKRERAHSSLSTGNDEWENMLPITEGDAALTTASPLQPIEEKDPAGQIIGMSNFRAKHRLRRRSKTDSLVRWREAVKKAVKLKDPWYVVFIHRICLSR